MFTVGNRDFAIVLDHVHHVIADFAKVGPHFNFTGYRMPIENEAFMNSAIVERSFVSRADFWRQFRRSGVFLAVIADLASDRDAHVWSEMRAFRLPLCVERPLL